MGLVYEARKMDRKKLEDDKELNRKKKLLFANPGQKAEEGDEIKAENNARLV